MFLIDDRFMAPIAGFKFVLRTLERVAEEQWTDDAPLKERLLELQVRLDQGEINEDQYAEEETAILRELREVQKRKMELAGVNPDEHTGPLTGKVAEGSGASVTIDTYGKTE